MRIWHEAQLHHLQRMAGNEDILGTAFELTRQLGFDYLAFATGPHQTMLRLEALSNMPTPWCQRYRQKGYAAVDPSVRHCLHSVVPLPWTDELFSSTPQFRRDAWAHGIRHGLSLAIHDSAHHISMVSLARRDSPLGADEFCSKVGECLWLGNLLHQRLGDQPEVPEPPRGHLTLRELEVLRWSAEGKTAGDIAAILSLSERTVNFHITSAVKKLGAGNKTAAVVRAAQAGLL